MRKQRKQVRHRCGQVLWSEVLERFEDQVVVNYRTEQGLLVFQCPMCGRPLRLWWTVSTETMDHVRL